MQRAWGKPHRPTFRKDLKMREIKFRAWDESAEEMISMPLDGYFGLERFFGFLATNQPSGFILMQYTGLKDKNGVDIYEGDVVQNQAMANRVVKRTKYGEYRLFCGNSQSHFYNGWTKGTVWEVIGNVHENPELLS
jgi:hypothetical protein